MRPRAAARKMPTVPSMAAERERMYSRSMTQTARTDASCALISTIGSRSSASQMYRDPSAPATHAWPREKAMWLRPGHSTSQDCFNLYLSALQSCTRPVFSEHDHTIPPGPTERQCAATLPTPVSSPPRAAISEGSLGAPKGEPFAVSRLTGESGPPAAPPTRLRVFCRLLASPPPPQTAGTCPADSDRRRVSGESAPPLGEMLIPERGVAAETVVAADTVVAAEMVESVETSRSMFRSSRLPTSLSEVSRVLVNPEGAARDPNWGRCGAVYRRSGI
mmetsp:Transcript_29469/g.77261  ORF Transcript_29469/g.77261 Transcript_29469/m.77261 type:complete len:277 (-) Transcript_29469:86-916(-)